jgi:thiol-disulfide isomerase/thioredoxin
MKSLYASALLAAFVALPAFAADQTPGGIGAVLGIDPITKSARIMRVLPNSPAAKAGIPTGAVLHKIQDTVVDGKAPADCAALIRGPVGSKLTLEVVDPRTHQTNQLEVARAIIDPMSNRAKLGDPAAPLAVKEWVKGGPVNVNDGKAIYVVEFWATWCGPCKVSIPHLSALQREYKDKGVVVVGVSDEVPDTVKPFVTKMGAQMDYAVACDDSEGTTTGYMEAYGINTIPTAFVVNKEGRVVWRGHPMMGLDKAVADLVAKQ